MTSSLLDWLDSLQGSGIRPGLGRVRALLRAVRNPQKAYASIIVAGTNGKGSTSSMIASILNAAGYRTGLYTSPHLVELRERWQIAGEMIDEALLDECIAELQHASGRAGITPTYFEALTVIAFIAFARAECEIAVLEVGMGGRLDATNVVRPLASVITPISYDHMEFLGTTLRKIAAEKAGVIHRGAIVLTSNEDPVVLSVLRRRAESFANRFIEVDDEHESPLAGAFQRRNAALAVRTARELMTILPEIDERAIARGVKKTRWRGRLESIRADGKRVWVDGGHNTHAAEAIAPFVEREVPHPRLLVFGVMRDKEVGAIASRLFPLFDRVITTEPYPPRSEDASALAALGRNVKAIPDPDAALEAAMAAPEQAVVVAGSLYLAGAALRFFDKIAVP